MYVQSGTCQRCDVTYPRVLHIHISCIHERHVLVLPILMYLLELQSLGNIRTCIICIIHLLMYILMAVIKPRVLSWRLEFGSLLRLLSFLEPERLHLINTSILTIVVARRSVTYWTGFPKILSTTAVRYKMNIQVFILL